MWTRSRVHTGLGSPQCPEAWTPQRAAAPGRGQAEAVTGQRVAGWSVQASGTPSSWAVTPLNGREAQCHAAPSRQPGRQLQGTGGRARLHGRLRRRGNLGNQAPGV